MLGLQQQAPSWHDACVESVSNGNITHMLRVGCNVASQPHWQLGVQFDVCLALPVCSCTRQLLHSLVHCPTCPSDTLSGRLTSPVSQSVSRG